MQRTAAAAIPWGACLDPLKALGADVIERRALQLQCAEEPLLEIVDEHALRRLVHEVSATSRAADSHHGAASPRAARGGV